VSELDNYQEKYSQVVFFNVNSSTLSVDDKQRLDDLAEQANSEQGYSIEIAGYTDKTWNAVYNQHLSVRANAVIGYLQEHGNIPVYRILRPAANP
jgi:outer membrane protein OmpA-like peptidoglycan-associated protein